MPSEPNALPQPPSRRRRWRRLGLLVVGAALLGAILLLNDPRAVFAVLLNVRLRALAVVAAHFPVILAAGLGWRVLLEPERRPGQVQTFRLRLIKEAINALLPVAQVGGDVVRARLAVSPRLPLRASAASCLVDVGLGIACLAVFLIAGLALAAVTIADPRIDRLALEIAGAGLTAAVLLALAERWGVLRLFDRLTAQSAGALGQLTGLGDEVRRLLRRRVGLSQSVLWHLLSWLMGVVETSVSLWAVGLEASWRHAFVLESLAQGARAVGFAIPGALGVQEGGYVLICAALGIPADRAVALSLLRRVREITLGGLGLAIWRFRTPPLPESPT